MDYKQAPEILPAGAWEREIESPKRVLTAGGGRARNEIFPMKLKNVGYYIRKYKHTSQYSDWQSVKSSLQLNRAILTIDECFDHVKSLDAAGEEALRRSGSYGRRNVFTDHARAWIKVATTMLWLKHSADVDGGATWPPTFMLRGAKFRRIFHPWMSETIIWIDGYGNHVPDQFGGAVGDDREIIATWEDLLSTGGYAEGERLILPTGTREGADVIRSYNESNGVTKSDPEMTPDPNSRVPRDIVTMVRGYYDANKYRPDRNYGESWLRVLIAFGEESHDSLLPFTVAEARTEEKIWSGWEPIRRVLETLNPKESIHRDPKPNVTPEPDVDEVDIESLIRECQEHVNYFRFKGHSAANRWNRVIGRLQGVTANSGDVSDNAIAKWLGLSRRHGWDDGKKTLPKVIQALKQLNS